MLNPGIATQLYSLIALIIARKSSLTPSALEVEVPEAVPPPIPFLAVLPEPLNLPTVQVSESEMVFELTQPIKVPVLVEAVPETLPVEKPPTMETTGLVDLLIIPIKPPKFKLDSTSPPL